jgi:serine protease AprX
MTDDNVKQPLPQDDPDQPRDPRKDHFNLGRATVPPALHDPAQRLAWQLPAEDDKPGPYMIELNLLYGKGVQKAAEAFEQLYSEILGSAAQERPAIPISKTYFRCNISVKEWKALIRKDEEKGDSHERVIYKIWPDFPLNPLIEHSVATVKADAAFRSFAATGEGVCWAVIDSGVDLNHIHFGHAEKNRQFKTLLDPSVRDLHRDFTLDDPQPISPEANTALTDGFGHGTHVAGIIAGGLDNSLEPGKDFIVFENVFESDPSGSNRQTSLKPRAVASPAALRGVAPQCKLVSLKVLDSTGNGRTSNIMRALQYIREDVNGDPKFLRIHGVNLSLGYEFDAEMFACGQSPLCVEVDRLVRSGVVVVVAAGNTGYASIQTRQRITKIGIPSTINDPGNSTLAITVGATHRDAPHTYGVSYFSSKGPTGDGRIKPDLVAPGERITSCAAGKKLERLALSGNASAYLDDSGTSMAAPHVSGAIAAFLSIRREFFQRPEEIKRIFLESATPLGRERYFEGRGLVDLMRAIQAV